MSCEQNTILEEGAWEIFCENATFENRVYRRIIRLYQMIYQFNAVDYDRILFDVMLKFDYELALSDPMECLKRYEESLNK